MVNHSTEPMDFALRWSAGARTILALALPLILTNFAHVALTTIDVVVLGKLGTLEIAAGGLAIALFNQIRTTGTGLITSVSNLVAEAHARDKRQHVCHLLFAGFFWATVYGLVLIAVLMFLERPLILLGQDPEVAGKAIQFLFITSPSLLPCLWFQTLRHFTVGLKYPGPLLLITLISIVLTSGLNYLLVFGKWGLPALGLKGVALATSIVFLLSFLMFLSVVLRNRTLAPHFTWSGLRWSSEAVKAVWKLGLPIAGTYASEAGFFSVLTLLIGTLGMEALAAQTVLNQIIYIVFMISSGISHAVSIHISEACSVRNYIRVRQLGLIALVLGVVSMLVVSIPYAIAPDAIVALFITADHRDNAIALKLAASGLLIAIVLQVFDATQNIGNGILRGIGNTSAPFKISLIGYWLIGLPFAYLLGIAANYGAYGVWVGQTIGLAATATWLVASFHRRINRMCRNMNDNASSL